MTRKNIIPILLFCCFSLLHPALFAGDRNDTTPLSTKQQALAYLDQQKDLQPSKFWPNVQPAAFLQNLRKNVENPIGIYEGRSTNFCAYSAMSYLPLHDDPLTFVSFLVKLYTQGKAVYGIEYFEPSREVKLAAGTLIFKGELDVRPADQLWFLSLADHFKGYLNFFDKHYNQGDENKMWAAVNFSKYNRMVRNLFNYKVDAIGSDIFRPGVRDIFEYLSDRLKTGTVALFVNNLDLYKKNHTRLKFSVPTHFVILLGVEETEDDKIAITYWDYGFRSRQVLTEKFLKKIIFGISHATKKTTHEK
ncbi:hypothetical protein GWC95_06640 [Sediminibacterium roseum]|uniref:Peptidase C39-like domain-containing protein n=1 Tax=Sediminibacterium roseum TaxID=1978412 RepID=A0ABW9ZR48_9BACT|nr:hypothetical protein [Sediminibacterium roseum]NCI49591.1 hypothetical protein [Sediminibacterium roseum]